MESIGIFEPLSTDIRIIRCPIQATNRPLRILWEQLILPFQILHHRIDLLLSAGLTAPFFCPATSDLVLYDLQHINQPQNFSRPYLWFLKNIIYWSAKSADGILTISHHVKRDIMRLYHIHPERIAVTHLAVDHDAFFPLGRGDNISIRKKYKLPEHYFLYAAALLPHKNHESLLKAFKEIKDDIRGWKLVFTGAWEKGHDKLITTISALGLQDDVALLGWLPFEDIPAIYREAELFVFPSRHEGFGLPILEAMASGVPVVCSRMEPLIEVAGNAALFVNPDDPADIARAIITVLKDKPFRMKLIDEGLKRSREFTWDNTALKTLTFLLTSHGSRTIHR